MKVTIEEVANGVKVSVEGVNELYVFTSIYDMKKHLEDLLDVFKLKAGEI